MTTKTLAWIAPETNEWTGDKGTVWFVNVRFDDGESGSLGKKDSTQAEWLRQKLEKLIGTPAEFGLKDSGKKTNEGATKWYIESFPGYDPPSSSKVWSGGGKRDFVPRYQDTAEGFASLQASMDRRTALMQATAVCVGGFIGEAKVIGLADSYYSWLRNVSPEKVSGEQPVPDVDGEAAKGTGGTSGGQAQGVVAGSVDAPQHPLEDSPHAGTSETPSQDEPEVSVRGASTCLHTKGSETHTMASGSKVERCISCKAILEDVRA